MSAHWEGVKENTVEHHTTGSRAWCYQDSCGTWCYKSFPCDCCKEAQGWRRMWLTPDGEIFDDNREKYSP